MEGGDTGNKIYYSGIDKPRNGVGIIAAKYLKDKVVAVFRKRDIMMLIKLVVGGNVINVTSVYAPQVGLDEDTKYLLWNQLDKLMQEIPVGENVIIGEDFNGNVGENKKDYEMVQDVYGFVDRNEAGESMLEFTVAYDLTFTNTLFKKREERLITFKSGVQ